MSNIFLSLRLRIFLLFLLSIIGFVTAIVFGLLQLQHIGDGLDRINVCYLPLSEEIAYTQSSMRLIEQEHERLQRADPYSNSRMEFFMHRLEEHLTDTESFLNQTRHRPFLSSELLIITKLTDTLAQSKIHLSRW